MIRFFDIIFSLIFILFFSPIFLTIIILIFFNSGKPIFYISSRVGINGKNFIIYKFRTMENEDREMPTKIGLYLRRTSLDETLQFFNILKGDMSIVGPRPLPYHLNNQISNEQLNKRQSVRPGLTGLSQINYKGKKRLLDEKVVLDLKMIINFNIFDYFKIIFLTIPVIFKRFYYNVKGKTL